MRQLRGGRILVVEDDPSVAELLRFHLEDEGFVVSVAATGDSAIIDFREQEPALVLLDLMLPGIPGLEVCRVMRAESAVPIIIVSAKDDEVDKVIGLELGADDYVTKPFSALELMSRVRASMRRSARIHVKEGSEILEKAGITLDIRKHEAIREGKPLDLSVREFDLLATLLRANERLVTTDQLGAQIWGGQLAFSARILYTQVMRLRSKIEADPAHPVHLVTVRGLGYRFVG